MLKRSKLLFSALAITVLTVVVFQACTKDEMSASGSGATQNLKIYLTDDPAQFDKLLVQIKSVEVKLDTGKHRDDDDWGHRPDSLDKDDDDDDRRGHDDFGQWDTLNIAAGEYDILSLRNGIDTILAQGTIRGTIRKIRIAIGTVTVVKDGVSYPVNLLPGVRNNYIYVHLRKEHIQSSGSNVATWVDFDVARSIVEINGKFYLKPVLKPFCRNNFGELKGVVLPAEARAIVRVYNATDTVTAIPDKDGKFKVRGLADGTYTVFYDGFNGYGDSTVNNVSVTKGKEKELGVVTLRK
jgi:hypothetical protein